MLTTHFSDLKDAMHNRRLPFTMSYVPVRHVGWTKVYLVIALNIGWLYDTQSRSHVCVYEKLAHSSKDTPTSHDFGGYVMDRTLMRTLAVSFPMLN